MTDPRFTTAFDDLPDLLNLLDVDEVGDIETLLMFLLARPIQVGDACDDDGVSTSLDVIVRGNGESVGSVHDFPMSVIEFVRSCAQVADELGPYAWEGASSEEAQDVVAMGDAELVAALQQALGKVRLFNLMDFGE